MAEPPREGSGLLSRALRDASSGEPMDMDGLFVQLYEQLHALAGNMLVGERDEHTLQPTALVNEAYLRLVDGVPVEWRDRKHFMSVAARAMRHVLIDHGRRRSAAKRGGGWRRITLVDDVRVGDFPDTDIFALSIALSKLERVDPELSRIVELRVFGGLTMQEIADLYSVTRRTMQNHWRVAMMWLRRELTDGGDS